MTEIAELERRITAALERIGQGVAALSATPGEASAGTSDGAAMAEATAKIAALEQALAAERGANAQLTERVGAIRQTQETTVSQLEQRVQDLTRQLDVQGLELQRMKKTNVQLRETARTLREALEAQVAEPQLINKTMVAELEALRASRLSEIAEMDEILDGLAPLIGEVAAAGSQTGEQSDA
ncbi:hypothetical protein [Acidimangrovimonas pyrenivorans]|uniref:Colicin transporter n=1 Tax=Acidimangrovimonas pyrenivorans TaxID=2030798 RepID=A0ABV7ACV4_9RHOB